jgi:flagellar secretion chaperone FliS
MSFSSNRSAQSYRHLGAETALVDADPHRIISLLFDAALDAINRARHALAQRDIPARGQAISAAIRIIQEGLQASLDLSTGSIAQNLSALYDYMGARLLVANRHADDSALHEVATLLQEIRAGWAAIEPASASAVPARAN